MQRKLITMKKKNINAITLFSFLLFSIIYLEFLFKIRVLSLHFDFDLFRISIFSISYAILIMFILMFFKRKAVKITIFTLTGILSFLYLNQEVYSSFVEGFYSVTVAGDFTAGLSFFSDYLTSLKFGHIFYFFPMISLYVLNRYKVISFDVEYSLLKQPLVILGAGFLVFFLSLQTISEDVEIQGTSDNSEVDLISIGNLLSYSDMDLYTYMYNSTQALKKFGLLTYTQRDFFSMFRTDPLSEEAYKVLVDDYYDNRDEHNDNLYTDLFKGKNLIMIMAESLDTFAINEELTPTLWALKNDSAYFENFYSPLYYRSTADSEFLVQTSMYPDKNVTLSMEAYIDNYLPNTLPKMFEEQGYSTFSFHNYTDYFYPRSDFHINTLGYNQFWGSEELGMTAGFDPNRIIFNHHWESDLEMMKLSVDKFIDEDQFFVNYITVSGHFDYSQSHEIATEENVAKVQEYVDTLDPSVEIPDDIFYYLAVHVEVDKAIKYLMDELAAKGKLDDTVIMIFGDHYAYGIGNDDIWAYEDEYKIDDDEMDIHNVPMMIISDSTFLDGTISNYMSTVDVMPTIANLFGLNMDYKLAFGNDGLGVDGNVVRFADGSFISSEFSYNALSEEYIIFDESVSETFLFNLNHKYLNDYMYNLLTLEYDFFNKKK